MPTSQEAGVDNFVMPSWYAMYAPAGTSRDIIARLHREITKALDAPDLRNRLVAAGINPRPGSPDERASLLRTETARYAKIIQSVGLRMR